MNWNIVVSIIMILMHIKQVMSIFDQPSDLTAGEKEDGYKVFFNDNPNIGQTLLSQNFINTARQLFDKEKSSNKYNFRKETQERYNSKIKNEDTGKNKGDNVGYYAIDGEVGGEVNSENNVGHSLLDHYGGSGETGTATTPGVGNSNMRRIPVQCVETNPKQMVCTHGDVIYKLVLPSSNVNEDDLRKLVETVYQEIESKHKDSFISWLHKRERDKRAVFNDIVAAETLFDKEQPSKVYNFNISVPNGPKSGESENDIETNDENETENTFETLEEIQSDENKKVPRSPPTELLYELNSPPAYSCRWFSKRQIPTRKIKIKRRAYQTNYNKIGRASKKTIVKKSVNSIFLKNKKLKRENEPKKEMNEINCETQTCGVTPLAPLGVPILAGAISGLKFEKACDHPLCKLGNSWKAQLCRKIKI